MWLEALCCGAVGYYCYKYGITNANRAAYVMGKAWGSMTVKVKIMKAKASDAVASQVAAAQARTASKDVKWDETLTRMSQVRWDAASLSRMPTLPSALSTPPPFGGVPGGPGAASVPVSILAREFSPEEVAGALGQQPQAKAAAACNPPSTAWAPPTSSAGTAQPISQPAFGGSAEWSSAAAISDMLTAEKKQQLR
jgi:hypothetical protein